MLPPEFMVGEEWQLSGQQQSQFRGIFAAPKGLVVATSEPNGPARSCQLLGELWVGAQPSFPKTVFGTVTR